MESYQYKIRQQAKSRGIVGLYHFTRFGNAEGILRDGLVSRANLDERKEIAYGTDDLRLDGRRNTVSVSINSINEGMFKAKQRSLGGDWLIFEVHPSVLWTHSCRFCWTNAAKSEIRHHKGFLGGPWAFSKMFGHRPGSLPTDQSAEVMVIDPISPDLIVDVTVKSDRVKDKLESIMRKIDRARPVEVYSEIFI